ncbi:MAG: hypothetical protein QF493_11370, partial [Rhodospirillales bacterium]|nr:hypothetical protein [Rhodospirillales bacterium]
MTFINNRSIVVSATVLITGFLTGCSFPSETLLPSLTGEDPSGSSTISQRQVASVRTQPPAMGTTKFEPKGVTAGSNSGTLVGQK